MHHRVYVVIMQLPHPLKKRRTVELIQPEDHSVVKQNQSTEQS